VSDGSTSDPGVLRSDPNLLDVDVEAPVARLEDFEIERKLATNEGISSFLAVRRGAFGFSKRVMLKVADAPFQESLAVALRLTDEARLGMRLSHPNLLQTLDLGRDADRFFLVREWVDGLGLRALMHRMWTAGERVPVEALLRVGVHVARALEYLHTLGGAGRTGDGIVHRAVTPSNVLLSRAGEVRLATLFMARPSGVGGAAESDQAAIPAYRAPEVERGQLGDPRADLYSLGAVLYEAVVGPEAFDGGTHSDWVRFRNGDAVARRVRTADMEPRLRSILLRALEPDVDRRFGSAGEMKDALRHLQSQLSGSDGDQILRDLVARHGDASPHAASAVPGGRSATGDPS
jgi:serine/threonine protein kinase